MIRHLRWLVAVGLVWGWTGRAGAWQEAPESRTETKTAAEREAEERAKALAEAISKIKEEGQNRSKVMETLEYLTDVIGPRLTASPGIKRANEWTRDKMMEWGLENGKLEAWGPFGRGWTLKSFTAQVVEPQCIPLIAYPKAWTPGLDGPVVGPVVHLDATDEAGLEKYKGKLKGAVVLLGRPREVKAWMTAPGERFTDTQLLGMANASPPQPRVPRGPRPRREGAGPAAPTFLQKRAQFLLDEGAVVTIEPSFRGDGGTLFVQSASIPSEPGKRINAWDVEVPRVVPQVVCSIEHFNRMVRMLAAGEPLKVAMTLEVAFHDDDLMGYNTTAEIPGTDLKDEVVMMGGHLDSWHSGTGATDNGAGCAVVMEAARIIKALDLKPRRTIRVALWSGEEQGLFGSRTYVRQHFGQFEPDPNADPGNWMAALFGAGSGRPFLATPEYEKLSVYFNLDNGTGKIRGVYMEGNEAARPLFRTWLNPFRDMGAATLTISPTFGTDHQAFDAVGLPGFQFIQDPIEYEPRTHHSNQDVFDRIQAEDLKQASVIMAAMVYQAAMADERFPRKPVPFVVKPAGSESGSEPETRAAAAGGQN
ncbi:MAG: hypothetical protein KatS3mg108_3204 [Isosphaeraceae bacterium]|nr:MAG: hypothetical protein KatS3mg108_3204 [Isosphaeraceae bacterium]